MSPTSDPLQVSVLMPSHARAIHVERRRFVDDHPAVKNGSNDTSCRT